MCYCVNEIPAPIRSFVMTQVRHEYFSDPAGLKLLQTYKKWLSSPDDLKGLPQPVYRLLHLEVWMLSNDDDFNLDRLRKLKAFRWPMTWLLQVPELQEWPQVSTESPARFVH